MISPQLLQLLAEMGHGEEILLADANFPAGKYCSNVIQLPGADNPALLAAMIPLWSLDYKMPPLIMPQSNADCSNVDIKEEYQQIIRREIPEAPEIIFAEGEAFYRRAAGVRVCVVTGERRRFANLIIRKGVL